MSDITVVTPTIAGREAFLEEAKATVAAQTLKPAAHLIELDVDHRGPAATLAKLVDRSETEWVSILADDDLYDPDHLETLHANSSDADIVLSWSRFIGSDQPQHRGPFDVDRLRSRQDTGMRGCFMFRRSLYDKIGGWPQTLGDDRQFLLNAADAGARLVPVYRETWSYRQHEGSTSAIVTSLLNGEKPDNMLHLGRMMTADVTVLIPILRSARNDKWLQECIQSFPEGTRYLLIENDGDMADALNQALATVTTEWILPFGHDDVAEEGMVERLVSAGHDADVVYPAMLLVDEEMKVGIGVFNADIFCGNRLQTWNYVPGAFIARTEAVRKIGGWRHLDALEDWDLHVRLFKSGARFKACPQARMRYRQVDGSRNEQLMNFASAQEMRTHFQDLISVPPVVKATFYYQATPAVSYWRTILPARYLPGVAKSVISLEAQINDRKEVEFLDHQGAAVFQFPGNNEHAAALLAFQAGGNRFLVEVDDNYLDENDFLFRKRAGWELNIGGKSPHSVQGHRWITRNADGVIVTTRKLAEIYGEVNDNIYVCRNSVDPTDWPEFWKPDDGVFRIGWFASQSHDRDSELVRKALSWASRQPGVEVVTVGLDPVGWDFNRLHVGWSDDFGVYRQALHLLDVGVAPILRTSSAVCRSDLKILENAMAGAMTIAQRLDPYEEWFDDKNTLTASTAKEFYDHVRWCVGNQDEAREMGRRAREFVLSERTIQSEIRKWEAAVV